MHRWLIHHVLAAAEFNPPNLVFPISAVILRRLHRTTVGTSSNAVIRMTSTPGTRSFSRLRSWIPSMPDMRMSELAPVARRWLLRESPQSLHDSMLFRFLEWEIVEQYEGFLRSGKPLDVHGSFASDEEWDLYQRGMRSLAGTAGPEVARRTPVPKEARDMLDIGGSHGYFSVVLCRRHPGLRSVVLDLPAAVEKAAPLLASEGMGDRVVHRAGDALADDLGIEAWDLVFVAQLLHHFDDATNRELARRVSRALRPGGIFVIQEAIRPASPDRAGQTGALLDLYFALTSEAGTWSFEEMADWQREAGLEPKRPIRFRTVPGVGQQAAVKPRA